MKRHPMAAGMLALATTVSLAPKAPAAGLIVVDPITPGVAIRPGIITVPVTPPGHPIIAPGHPSTPFHPPGHQVLHGGVSFGLHMKDESIKVEITDQVAKTYITQTFMNDTDQNLAGTYLFPLPEDTTFSSFSLHIDGKPIEGKILEASAAREQYEEIVRKMVDPGLLEYADYKTARARIFPIPAHGTKKVELEYTQLLKADNGLLKYSFPMKAEGDEVPVEDVKLDLKISSKQGLRTVWSPSHTVTTTRPDNHMAKVAFASHEVVPDKDFLLYYSVSDKDLSANLLTNKATDVDGFFLVTLTPPMKATTVQPKDIVLVADVSGSMEGDKLKEAKQALKYVVNALNPEDRFSIVSFNTDVESYNKNLVQATPENKKSASHFVDELEARGGTNIGDAIKTGTSILHEKSDRPAYMVLCTDGEPTVGETSVSGLAKRIGSQREIRVFDFGVGFDVNTRLMNKLAELNHGTTQYVQPSENLETALSAFYQKIKSPVLTNVSIAFNGIQTKDIYPKEVTDIFAGNQVMLLGRYKGSGNATLSLTGKLEGKEKSYSFPLKFEATDADHTYLPRLWAMRRIGHLTDVAQENHNNQEIVNEIVSLSKKYGIITQYTSFLVTDPGENHFIGRGGIMPSPSPVPMATRSRVHGGGAGGGAASVESFGGFGSPVRGLSKSAMAPSAAPQSAMVRRESSYSGPRQLQMVDDKPIIRDFRAALDSNNASPAGEASFNFNLVNNRLKGSDSLGANEDGTSGKKVKVVGDRTFYFANNTWNDNTYKVGSIKPQKIEFGSKDYFDLLKNNPGISKYLAVGKQVIFMYKGKCYEIVLPTA